MSLGPSISSLQQQLDLLIDGSSGDEVRGENENEEEIGQFLDMESVMLAAYVSRLSDFLITRIEGDDKVIRNSPLVDRLMELRTVIEKCKPLEDFFLPALTRVMEKLDEAATKDQKPRIEDLENDDQMERGGQTPLAVMGKEDDMDNLTDVEDSSEVEAEVDSSDLEPPVEEGFGPRIDGDIDDLVSTYAAEMQHLDDGFNMLIKSKAGNGSDDIKYRAPKAMAVEMKKGKKGGHKNKAGKKRRK